MLDKYKIGNLYNFKDSVMLITDKIANKDRFLVLNYNTANFEHWDKEDFIARDLDNRIEHEYAPGDKVRALHLNNGNINLLEGHIISKYSNYSGVELFRVEIKGSGQVQEYYRGEIIKDTKNTSINIGDFVEINDTFILKELRKQGKIVKKKTIEGPFLNEMIGYIVEDFNGNELGCFNRVFLTKLPKSEQNKANNSPICYHTNKYKNIISANLQFWYCPDCKKDLGDV